MEQHWSLSTTKLGPHLITDRSLALSGQVMDTADLLPPHLIRSLDKESNILHHLLELLLKHNQTRQMNNNYMTIVVCRSWAK